MALDLLTILEVDRPQDYKFHAARWNNHHRPLDVFTRDRAEWRAWNTWRSSRDDFNRRFIISFIDFYLEERTWLFGGIFEVLGRGAPGDDSYSVADCERGADLIGRLKIRAQISRGRSFLFENLYPRIAVSELLKEPYTGEAFPGYQNVSLDFSMLEAIVRNDRLDWKTALQNVKGIYLIVDRQTGKKYVGSACNAVGVWARWCSYVATGHGGNVDLIDLIRERGLDYPRENFRVTLLESWPFQTHDSVILARESFWKQALLTRGDFGHNRN